MGVNSDEEKSKKPSVEQIDGFFMKMTKRTKEHGSGQKKKSLQNKKIKK
jgi:hypothetical protein